MISDEQIHEAVRLACEASRQYQQWLGPAPQLRLNSAGVLELAEPDTHDEWRRLNNET